nr:hypothetical protein [Tanacetum cinerariifolium]
MNEDTPVGVASAVKEGVTPSVGDMMVKKMICVGGRGVKEKNLNKNSMNTSSAMPVTTTTGNAPGKSWYANITGKPSGKKVNVRTLFTPGGNRIDVVVSVDSIRAISE